MNSKKVLEEIYYRFDAFNRKIIFSPALNIDQKQILLITNMNGNVILYNFGCSDDGGVFSGRTLTLAKDTTRMSDNDKLMVVVTDEDKSEGYLKVIADQIKNTNEILLKIVELQNIKL